MGEFSFGALTIDSTASSALFASLSSQGTSTQSPWATQRKKILIRGPETWRDSGKVRVRCRNDDEDHGVHRGQHLSVPSPISILGDALFSQQLTQDGFASRRRRLPEIALDNRRFRRCFSPRTPSRCEKPRTDGDEEQGRKNQRPHSPRVFFLNFAAFLFVSALRLFGLLSPRSRWRRQRQ